MRVRRPALILLLFAAARIPLLIVRAPFFDELFTRWISANTFAGIVSALRWDSGPPLYYFVVHLLGDPSVAATRMLSLICAAISLALVILRLPEPRSGGGRRRISSYGLRLEPRILRSFAVLRRFAPSAASG